ncbi:MAG: hypothetical protein RIQ56_354 [Candidatus Parcubacteria bacterium]
MSFKTVPWESATGPFEGQSMDNQKDNASLIKFFDNYSYKTNPFAENRVGERAYRRSERIAAAVHLLTNHIPLEEISRNKARQLSVNLLSQVLALRDEMRATNSDRAREFRATVRELISVLRLLNVAGLVSAQNVDTIAEAIDELPVFLSTSQRSNLSESVSISRDDLIDVRDIGVRAPSRSHDEKNKKDITDNSHRTDTSRDVSVPNSASQKLGSFGDLSIRSQAILEVLRAGGELAIRDVTSNLPEYSEKMVQRELAALVEAGRVRKTGLKRWSRYSII